MKAKGKHFRESKRGWDASSVRSPKASSSRQRETVLDRPGRAGKTSAEIGLPTVAQWLTNSTRNHDVVGSTPGLTQWVKDPALPQAAE